MNWEVISAIADAISALGVIVTLIYLAIQIRANTQESRIASTSEISHEYNAFLRHVTSDKELTDLWFTALDGDISILDDSDRARLIMMVGNIMRVLENAYIQFKAGRMDSASWEGYDKILRRGASRAMIKLYWDIRNGMHSSAYVELVNDAISNPDKEKMFQ